MKELWIIELGKFLLASMQKGFLGNLLAMAVVSGGLAYGGVEYVNRKHDDVTSKVQANTKKISELVEVQSQVGATLLVMQNTLKNMSDNVKQMKRVVEATDERVWKIREEQLRKGK